MQRNARAWLGPEHDDDALVNKNGFSSADAGEMQYGDEAPGDQLAIGNGIEIAIVRPRNFRDAATVGEYYRQEIPVIINLEDMDNAEATRIIDFVSGLILGLCGDIERISRRTFLIVPVGAAILLTHDGLAEDGFFNQALRPISRCADLRIYSSLACRRHSSRPRRDQSRHLTRALEWPRCGSPHPR